MKRYRFDPHRMRSAYLLVAEAFPLENRMPPGLALLFQMLEQIDLKALEQWSQDIESSQVDLLCNYFDQAQGTRALLALSIVLAWRKDRRCSEVLRYFFLKLPPQQQLQDLKQFWQPVQMREYIFGDDLWISRFVDSSSLAVAPFVIDLLKDGSLRLDALLKGSSEKVPLFMALLEFLFTEGKRLLPSLQPETAAEFATHYLESGRDEMVIGYLDHYPDRYWKPEFLEKLLQMHGVLDQRSSAFYRKLERGTMWRLRNMTFSTKLDALSSERHDLWTRWLHRCHSWEWQGDVAHISLGDLNVIENIKETQIYRKGVTTPLYVVPCNSEWSMKMEEILAEQVSWG